MGSILVYFLLFWSHKLAYYKCLLSKGLAICKLGYCCLHIDRYMDFKKPYKVTNNSQAPSKRGEGEERGGVVQDRERGGNRGKRTK